MKTAVLLACLQAAIIANSLRPRGVSAEGECGKVKCGMGTCSESSDHAFGFACRCNPGWRQNRLGLGDAPFLFLPCVVPNCTIKNSCQDGASFPPPVPSPPPPPAPSPTNLTIFDPCLMQYCGDGGACEKASDFTHRCRCRDGYANLFNDTAYPCYRQCSLGTDCKGLGIDVLPPISSPPAPVSFTVKKSGTGPHAASADRLPELLALVSFLWVQTIW